MKPIVAALFVLASFASAEVQESGNPVFGYLTKYGIPEAERIRQAEERYLSQRIVGGVPAGEGQYPYQAGLLISLVGFDGTAVCGGVLISSSRIATAAHCWNDGQNQAWKFTVVLGSNLLFNGGTRLDTSAVVAHPNWSPRLARNDVAVGYLPNAVAITSSIAPVSLPSGSQINEDFSNSVAIASGFGLTSDNGGISASQFLSHVSLNVISNSVCSLAFPLILQDTNICTSGIGGVGTCSGDSGGPLVINRDGNRVLIGIVSFGSALGCQVNMPAAYARVTSFVDFFNQHI